MDLLTKLIWEVYVNRGIGRTERDRGTVNESMRGLVKARDSE